MIRTQLSLFKLQKEKEKELIKDIDYIDVSKIKMINSSSGSKKYDYKDIPEGKFILYKTGGKNKWRPNLGEVFPYIKNTEKNYVLKPYVNKSYIFVNIGKMASLHRLVCEAFIVNKDPKKFSVVNHINKDRLDYRVDNLEWSNQSSNTTGLSRPRDENFEIRKIKEGII
jgi:hypothetical protein